VVDVGAGDGLASLRAARRDPGLLAIALDPSVDRLRIGARGALRQKIPNALFVVARIEDLPCELRGAADDVTIRFPWGSLLRGLVRADPLVLRPLAELTRVGARVHALISVTTRDQSARLSPEELDSLPGRSASFSHCGFEIESVHTADAGEIAASDSSWAKRLGPGRVVLAVMLRRLADGAAGERDRGGASVHDPLQPR
jgi:16S rRNA (adenine(1408)-N(1))-methyltransferase